MEGWTRQRLIEACEIYQPKTISAKEMVVDGPFPVFGANGIIGRFTAYNHVEPQVLITCRGATCGSVNVSLPQSWITGNAMVVRPRTSDLDIKFLEYFCRGGIDYSKVITGAAQPQITRQSLAPVEIYYPSLPEQRRIVAILDKAFERIDKAIANTQKSLANARQLFSDAREAILSPTNPEWVPTTFSQLCDIKHGFAFEGQHFTSSGDHVLLTPGNFYESGGFRDRGEKQKYYVGPIPDDFVLSPGDLLVAMTEQAAGLLGSPILVPDSARFLHNQRLGLVQIRSGVVCSNELLFHFFNTRFVRKAIHDSASGVKVRHTSPKKIGQVQLSLPRSANEQQAIVERLDGLHREICELEQTYHRKLAALTELKAATLAHAFSGRLGYSHSAVQEAAE